MKNQLLSIQYLRAIAALLVLLFHVGLYFRHWHFPFGNFGVDLFFVISGFVMYVTGRNDSAQHFFLKRLIRIVPLYWFVTALVIVNLTIILPSVENPVTLGEVFKSLLFIAYENPRSRVGVAPLLTVGWTLNVEMFFYLVFAAALFLASRFLVVAVGAALFAFVAIGQWGPELPPELAFYTRAIMLEFTAGIVIGYFWVRGIRLPLVGVLLVLGLAILSLLLLGDQPRVIAYGVPATLFVIFALAIEDALRRFPVRAFLMAGDSSYALYLIHMPVLALIAGFATTDAVHDLGLLMSIGMIFGFLALAYAIYRGFELPVTRYLRGTMARKFNPSGTTRTSSNARIRPR